MMRSLWTAASGMKTQQAMVDSISNNLSNVNTIGYKKERLEFKSLLYETMREAGSVDKGEEPLNLQVGHGVKTSASVKSFTQGVFERTEGPLDFAVEGEGFFVVQDPNGVLRYSRDGAFKLAMNANDNLILTNSSGNPIIGADGSPIEFVEDVTAEELQVDEYGNFSIMVEEELVDLGLQIQVVQFANAQGLKSLGGSLYATTVSSGEAMSEADSDSLQKSQILQGGLEGSNVQAVEEMVKLIVAQRAYELSSKAIQTSDDMLQLANQLKR